MVRKARKLFRYYKSRWQPRSSLPFFWHVGRPNFGDDINPSFFQSVCDERTRLEIQRHQPHFLGMGSILDRATSASIILGAGCLTPLAAGSVSATRVVSVRGELSRQGLPHSTDVLLGDPMVLLNLVAPQAVQRNGPVGFVPHVSDLRRAQKMSVPGLKVIDPGHEPWKVIRDIAGCARIFSQSLHGLIVADALEIPNAWIAPSASMKGGTFKFEDYFSTLDAPKEALPFDRNTFLSPPKGTFQVCRYKYDKAEYLDALRDALATKKRGV